MTSMPTDASSRSVSLKRVSAIGVPIALAISAIAYLQSQHVPPRFTTPAKPINELVLTTFGLGQAAPDQLDRRFSDTDGDLVADPPTDPSQQVQPETIVFSYIPGEEAEKDAEKWEGFVAHLSQATGRRVEYLPLANVGEQLSALRDGRLHVTGFNSGAVSQAVANGGFVPVCTYGNDRGQFGYRMQIVVRAQNPWQKVEDLRGHRIGFTHLSSNSGFKAAFVLLMSQYQLLPERDYLWAFSGGHHASLAALKSGRYDAAALASDLVEQAMRDGLIAQGELRVIYESELFPPAGLGYVYNLEPKLAQQVRDALLNYPITGTRLTDFFGPTSKFLPVTYKDDWATIRRIDQLLTQSGKELQAPSATHRTSPAASESK